MLGCFCSAGLQPHPSSRREHRGIFVCWASHRLRLGERRSSSSSGDNPDFKENLKIHNYGDFQTKDCTGAGLGSCLSPACAAGEQEEAAAPEALTHSSASPKTCPAHSELSSPAGCSKLRYEMLSWSTGCELSAGFPADLEEQPLLGTVPCATPAFCRPLEGSFTSWVQHGYVDVTQTVHIGSVYA